ncbi:MAG: hydroxypyruvate isomerase family protein [Gammaproteobacteria bacterium]
MPRAFRLALNLSTVFTELPLEARFAAAAEQGFAAVELQFPYDRPAQRLAAAAAAAGVEVVLINAPVGDLLDGGPGLSTVPGREREFETALETCERYVEALSPRCVNVLAGRQPPGVGVRDCCDTYVASLRKACERLAPHGVTTVFEALNSLDVPGFLVSDVTTQCRLMDAVAHEQIRLQVDFYHMTRTAEDIASFLQRDLARVGHIQFADVPGRGEPGTGAIDFAPWLALLEAGGYAGYLSAEYFPVGASADSFDWLRRPPFDALDT